MRIWLRDGGPDGLPGRAAQFELTPKSWTLYRLSEVFYGIEI